MEVIKSRRERSGKRVDPKSWKVSVAITASLRVGFKIAFGRGCAIASVFSFIGYAYLSHLVVPT